MHYSIQINVRDDSDDLIKVVRGDDLSVCTLDEIDRDIKYSFLLI